MELATATLLSAEQTEPAHHFRLVHWLIPVLGKLFDPLGCQPMTQKFTVCIIVQGGKKSSISVLTVARRSIPPYHFFHQGRRNRSAVSWILCSTSSFPTAHITQSAQVRCRTAGLQTQLCSCPRAILSQGRTDQKAAPLENGTVLKLKCPICNSGLYLDSHWHVVLNPHCTSTKLRGEELSGVDGAREAGKDMACASLTYFFWSVAAVAVGRRSSGKGGPWRIRT